MESFRHFRHSAIRHLHKKSDTGCIKLYHFRSDAKSQITHYLTNTYTVSKPI